MSRRGTRRRDGHRGGRRRQDPPHRGPARLARHGGRTGDPARAVRRERLRSPGTAARSDRRLPPRPGGRARATTAGPGHPAGVGRGSRCRAARPRAPAARPRTGHGPRGRRTGGWRSALPVGRGRFSQPARDPQPRNGHLGGRRPLAGSGRPTGPGGPHGLDRSRAAAAHQLDPGPVAARGGRIRHLLGHHTRAVGRVRGRGGDPRLPRRDHRPRLRAGCRRAVVRESAGRGGVRPCRDRRRARPARLGPLHPRPDRPGLAAAAPRRSST